MRVSRPFLLIGGLYLITGMMIGSYMGASGDHRLAPVHAHINLLGFALMTIFGLLYYVFPQMEGGRLAQVHFWLHQAGSLALMLALWLMLSQRMPEATVGPVMPLIEAGLVLGTLTFLYNLWRSAR
ncbi:hypothetical protein [Falsigemmobacter faecalis]|uniref:Cytochrome-c oxidase n=1 Tax=Falsigemmobacter faecalis TaxID=2488730 RepID=A0A3P3DVY3_9RHOB|nr:hypothetical protein [Falsigemmobacter faecalis]RRH78433.1 hypothetical protein EG244_00315 [Falsigemmobacter faecalis]